VEKQTVRDFPFTINIDALARKLHIENDPDDEDFQRISEMLAEALACARPKFAYGVAAIGEKGDDYVVVEGYRLVSPLVRRNLDKVHRIVPYIATCGVEADAWSRAFTDMLEHYWADEIKNQILAAAVGELRRTVQQRYFPDSRLAGDHPDADPHGGHSAGDMARMNPGSLPEWPVSQQPALFAVLDGMAADIGVQLTESCLMLPSKSVSGFFFSSETNFVNCRFCPILDCPNRSARHQPDMKQEMN